MAALALASCVHDGEDSRGFFSSSASVQPAAAPPQHEPAPASSRVLYSSSPAYAQLAYTQPAAPPPAAPVAAGGPYVAPDNFAAVAVANAPPYTLDSGDKLRVVVFGQTGISNTYIVDAGGNVSLPLIGSVPARGLTTQALSQKITARLKQGYVREPYVSVEIETNRPFFILGEVTNPGQYPYVANMTAEMAVAIAGGFAPRAFKQQVDLTRNAQGQQVRATVPLDTPLRPGDTVLVKERWF